MYIDTVKYKVYNSHKGMTISYLKFEIDSYGIRTLNKVPDYNNSL